MKVITIGSDRKLFEAGSAVFERMRRYASRVEELHIVVYAQRSHNLQPIVADNLFIYPTQSSSRWWYIWDAYRLARRVIVERAFVRGASVISAQDPFESGVVAYRLGRHFRLPFQLQVHTDFFSRHFKTSFFNNIRLMVSSFILKRAAGIRVVSNHLATTLGSRFPELKSRISVLPIYVDIAAIRAATPQRNLHTDFPQFNFIVLMASRLTKEKDIATALKAFAEVHASIPRAGLIIAGSGPEHTALERQARNLGLGESVVFMGWQNDLISCYKTADAFLLTSIYEGYGMVLIEAGAAGCPIITTEVGIASELCTDGHNSLVCPVGDVACLTRAMRRLITDNAARELFKRAMDDTINTMITVDQDRYADAYVAQLQAAATMHSHG